MILFEKEERQLASEIEKDRLETALSEAEEAKNDLEARTVSFEKLLAAAEMREQILTRQLADLRSALAMHWSDASTTEDSEIRAAHPTVTGRHDLYTTAMRLVGARRSKGSLILLVNWLLYRAEKVEGEPKR